jgi:hypothetical protein
MSEEEKSVFVVFYDKYSSMLYQIAMQISPNETVAEQIFVSTFRKAYVQNIFKLSSPCIILIRTLISAAHHLLEGEQNKSKIKLKQFKDKPILHNILCQKASFKKKVFTTETTTINSWE